MGNRLGVVILCLIAFSGCNKLRPGSGYLVSYEKLPLLGDTSAHRYAFKNGLKLIVVENPTSPTLAYQTWFDVGSKHEVPGKTGLAHLFEHMMFKATKNLKDGEFMKKLESEGAEGLNAFTSQDYTAYIQKIPKAHLEMLIKLESDRMVNLIVDKKAFSTEREVVQNERRMRNENNPGGKLYQAIFETSFSQHPYRWPVIGYEKDLTQMKAQDAFDFYQEFYGPSRATVVIVGDVKHNSTAKLIHKYYGPLKGKKGTTERVVEPKQKKLRRKTMKLNLQNEKIYMAYHIPGANSKEDGIFKLLPYILSTGQSSRLHKKLVESGLATYVSTGSFENSDPSLFVFTAGLQQGRSAKIAEKIIQSEISNLVQNPPSPSELKRALNQYLFSFYTTFTSNSGIAHFIGSTETQRGDYRKALGQHERAQSITAQEIQKVVKKYFTQTNLNVIIGKSK